MADLIRRQDAIDCFWDEKRYLRDAIDVVKDIRQLPSIDAVERKKGEWIDFSMSIKGVPTEACGECGEWSYGMGKNFCPHCGADMRGEEHE